MGRMKSGELFAGVGGLGMAVDAVFGTEPAWFAEVDEAPARVLAHRHPTVPNLGDVTRVNWDEAPRVNVLAGGFPCQDVSLAGARRGLKDGTRSGLWSEFAKAIDVQRPDWVVIENVRGLLSADAGGGTRIERDCSVCGWTDGRGRVHRDSRATQSGGRADVLRRPDHAGDDGTSIAGPDGVSGFVGRISDAEQGRDGSLGGGMGMDASGAGSGSGAAAADAVSADQAAAGGTGGGARGVQGVPTEKGERVADLDFGGREGVRGDEGGDSSFEREGAACPDCGGELIERVVSNMEPCPLCVGDDPRHALRALGAVLGDLADLGFDAEWTGIRASDIGAPHGRFRVFILAWPAENTRHGLGRQAQPGPAGSDDAPLGSDSRGGRGGHDPRLTLLPTPMAQPSGNSPEEHLRKKPGREVVTDLAIIAEHGLIASGGRLGAEHATDAEWGPYATAVARWEAVLDRPAPSPVRMDGKGGKPRLNPELPEWMMGWPAGWVTDPAIGLTRAQQLKAAGNGVVPQQAAAALVEMLARPGVPAVRQEVAA